MSPRQILILLLSSSSGFLISLPIPMTVMGVPFLGKIFAIGIFAIVGYVLGSREVKMVPTELQVIFRIFMYKSVVGKAATVQRSVKDVVVNDKQENPVMEKQEIMKEETLAVGVPLVLTEKLWFAPSRMLKITLVLDEQRIVCEDWVSPEKKSYKLTYTASPEDIGTHDLTIKLEGLSEPVAHSKITISSPEPNPSFGLLETKKATLMQH
jgi:hypothetical protein